MFFFLNDDYSDIEKTYRIGLSLDDFKLVIPIH